MWFLKALVDSDQGSWGWVFRVGGWYPQEWVVEVGWAASHGQREVQMGGLSSFCLRDCGVLEGGM